MCSWQKDRYLPTHYSWPNLIIDFFSWPKMTFTLGWKLKKYWPKIWHSLWSLKRVKNFVKVSGILDDLTTWHSNPIWSYSTPSKVKIEMNKLPGNYSVLTTCVFTIVLGNIIMDTIKLSAYRFR